MWLAFTPVDFSPLAWVCLVPLLQVARVPERVYRQNLFIWLGAATFWLATLQWMRLGDAWMYPAWGAHACYLATYWPLFILLTQVAVQRFKTPLYVAAPILWVGLEYLRGHLFTGFSWYLLGHSQHRWIDLIQISDLCGGYLVSFVIVLSNAALAQFVPLRWLESIGMIRPVDKLDAVPRDLPQLRSWGVLASVLAVGLSVGYGILRRAQLPFETGPRMALIQGDFEATTKPLTADDYERTLQMYQSLTNLSIPHHPDVVVWPEAMFRYPLLEVAPELSDEQLSAMNLDPEQWHSDRTANVLREMADRTQAALIIGIPAAKASPGRIDSYNSAVFVLPEAGVNGRYDKMHLVPFGEYIPLVQHLPFLSSLIPYGSNGGMVPGDRVHIFEHQQWRFVPLICFEDTVPHLVRSMAAVGEANGGEIDVLVNMSNDGWFHGSSEHDQHLITAAFRCVETRIPMARAANMGISAIIDGDGVIREPEVFIDFDAQLADKAPRTTLRNPLNGRFYRELNATQVSTVPLDKRGSLYVYWGDWFGMACLVCCISTALHGIWVWSRRRAVKTG